MSYSDWEVQVRRLNGQNAQQEFETISSRQLVPGDIFTPSEGQKMPCDAILLNGECVMDEFLLTGESVPVPKDPIPDSDEQIGSFTIGNKKHVSLYQFD